MSKRTRPRNAMVARRRLKRIRGRERRWRVRRFAAAVGDHIIRQLEREPLFPRLFCRVDETETELRPPPPPIEDTLALALPAWKRGDVSLAMDRLQEAESAGDHYAASHALGLAMGASLNETVRRRLK